MDSQQVNDQESGLQISNPLAGFLTRLKLGESLPEQEDFVELIEELGLPVAVRDLVLINLKAETHGSPQMNIFFRWSDLTPVQPKLVNITEVLRCGQDHVRERSFGVLPDGRYTLSVEDKVPTSDGLTRTIKIQFNADSTYDVSTKLEIEKPAQVNPMIIKSYTKVPREIQNQSVPLNAAYPISLCEQYKLRNSEVLEHHLWYVNKAGKWR